MEEAFVMNIKRHDILLKPDSRRVLYRSFDIKDRERIIKIISRVQSMTDYSFSSVSVELKELLDALVEEND